MRDEINPHTKELVDFLYKTPTINLRQLALFASQSDYALLHFMLREKIQNATHCIDDQFDELVTSVYCTAEEKSIEVTRPRNDLRIVPEKPLDVLLKPNKLSPSCLQIVSKALLKIVDITENGEMIEPECAYFYEFEPYLAPMKKPRSELLLSDMLPAIEFLKHHPGGLVMAGSEGVSFDLYHKWYEIADNSWALTNYL